MCLQQSRSSEILQGLRLYLEFPWLWSSLQCAVLRMSGSSRAYIWSVTFLPSSLHRRSTYSTFSFSQQPNVRHLCSVTGHVFTVTMCKEKSFTVLETDCQPLTQKLIQAFIIQKKHFSDQLLLQQQILPVYRHAVGSVQHLPGKQWFLCYQQTSWSRKMICRQREWCR